MKVQLKDKYIYWIAALNAILMILIFGNQNLPDTESYLSACDKYLSHGEIDMFRTPIYPIFLGGCKLIAGAYFLKLSVVIQFVVFLCSVKYFNRTASYFICSHKIIWCLSVLYATLPCFSSWSNAIQTESFGISGSVFFIYNICTFFQSAKKSYVFGVSFWLIFLIIFRPAFIYLLPICIFIWLISLKYHTRLSLCGLLGCVLAISLYLGYCYKFYEKYGVFSTSSVSMINQTYIAIQHGLIDMDSCYNYNTNKIDINNEGAIWDVVIYLYSHYDLVTNKNKLNESFQSHPREWIMKTLGRFYRAASESVSVSCLPILGTVTHLLGFSFRTIYIFLIIYFAIIIQWMIRTRTVHCMSFIIWLVLTANVLTAIIGAQSSWGRLITPSAPFILIMLGQATNYIGLKSKSNS